MGLRYADINCTERSLRRLPGRSTWELWVECPGRPRNRQVLTEGTLPYCCEWLGQLRRFEGE